MADFHAAPVIRPLLSAYKFWTVGKKEVAQKGRPKMSKLRGGCNRHRGLRAAAIVTAMAILTPSTKMEAAGGQPTIGPSAPQGNPSPAPSQPSISPPGSGGVPVRGNR